jgi:signal peptidase I
LLNRCVYLVRDPRTNDIVVIRDPSDNSYAVKRIVAGGGDSIYLKSGRVFVNGRELREPYLPPGTPTFANPAVCEQWVVCGDHQYFVMGDNRNDSADSRIYGPVPRRNILGMVVR